MFNWNSEGLILVVLKEKEEKKITWTYWQKKVGKKELVCKALHWTIQIIVNIKWKNRSKLQKKRTKWWRDSQPIRSKVQNTGNQDAQRNGWVRSQNRGKNGSYTKWNKGKYTGNQQWREGNQDSNQWFRAEGKINIQPEQNEETRIQKNMDRTRNLWDNFKHSNIQIIGVPEGEVEEQLIENLLEKWWRRASPIWQRK